jgi:hypothetical protein
MKTFIQFLEQSPDTLVAPTNGGTPPLAERFTMSVAVPPETEQCAAPTTFSLESR